MPPAKASQSWANVQKFVIIGRIRIKFQSTIVDEAIPWKGTS